MSPASNPELVRLIPGYDYLQVQKTFPLARLEVCNHLLTRSVLI